MGERKQVNPATAADNSSRSTGPAQRQQQQSGPVGGSFCVQFCVQFFFFLSVRQFLSVRHFLKKREFCGSETHVRLQSIFVGVKLTVRLLYKLFGSETYRTPAVAAPLSTENFWEDFWMAMFSYLVHFQEVRTISTRHDHRDGCLFTWSRWVARRTPKIAVGLNSHCAIAASLSTKHISYRSSRR